MINRDKVYTMTYGNSIAPGANGGSDFYIREDRLTIIIRSIYVDWRITNAATNLILPNSIQTTQSMRFLITDGTTPLSVPGSIAGIFKDISVPAGVAGNGASISIEQPGYQLIFREGLYFRENIKIEYTNHNWDGAITYYIEVSMIIEATLMEQ